MSWRINTSAPFLNRGKLLEEIVNTPISYIKKRGIVKIKLYKGVWVSDQ